MTDKKQDEEQQNDWEGEGGAPAPEPKQTTPKGLEIPVPTRDEIMDVFRRFVLLKPKR